ncbi:MAG TPA: serine/threonine-protein kinase [Blastocatellia bacterium]|nr:serine/threonine-protein kinase [Blastocatellia bacterium]
MIVPNTVLQNRYRILRQIGQGGMGSVYEAIHEQLRSRVAVKQTLAPDDTLRRALEREARLLSNLRHAALPKVIDHFTEADSQFMVMEFIPGNDLAALLEQRQSPFTYEQVISWADQLLDVLEYLHSRQPPVIHRDIKPQNLKLGERGEIILLDFGLAKGAPMLSRITSGSSILGYSLYFSPPEQMQGRGTDARSDLYSLAATIYFLITNTTPPDALTRAMNLASGQTDLLHRANEINPQVPQGIADLLYLTMSLNRDQRPSSASIMRGLLNEAGRHLSPFKGGGSTDIIGSSPKITATWQSQNKEEMVPENSSIEFNEDQATTCMPSLDHKSSGIQGDIPQDASTFYSSYTASERDTITALHSETIRKKQALPASDFQNPHPVKPQQVDSQTSNRAFRTSRRLDWRLKLGGLISIVISLTIAIIVIFRDNINPPTITPTSPRVLEGHLSGVFSVVFTPDGKTVASGSGDNTVKLWDVPTGSLRQELIETTAVERIALSPDGRTLAVGVQNDPRVKLWDMESGKLKQMLMGHTSAITSVAFSPDGKILASSSYDRTAKLWDIERGTLIRTLSQLAIFPEKPGTRIDFRRPISRVCAAFSPDGKTLATVSMEDNSIRLWDVQTGELSVNLTTREERIESITFSPDGKKLLAICNGLKMWDLQTGTLMQPLGNENEDVGYIDSVAFSSDGEIIAVGARRRIKIPFEERGIIGDSRTEGMVRLFDARTWGLKQTVPGYVGIVYALAFSPDGNMLATGSFDNSVKLLDLSNIR